MGNKNTVKNMNIRGKGHSAPKSVKPFPIGVALLLILLLSCTAVAACIFTGFMIDALITVITEGAEADRFLICIMITAVIATILYVLLFALIRHRRTDKNILVTRSYTDVVLIVLIFLAVGAAVTLIALNKDNNIDLLTAVAIFPAVGLITTPNAVRYSLKDMKQWERIFYGNGNLHRCKEDKDYYKVKTPVSFERRLFWAVFKSCTDLYSG